MKEIGKLAARREGQKMVKSKHKPKRELKKAGFDSAQRRDKLLTQKGKREERNRVARKAEDQPHAE